jgi:hypothetical protein
MLRLMDLRSPTAPWFSHSAMHVALHVGIVSPSDGRTTTNCLAGAGKGPAHQAQRAPVPPSWVFIGASTSAPGRTSTGAATGAARDRREAVPRAAGDRERIPSVRLARPPPRH